MSIAIMTEVWKDAPVSGTELLMLLALADSCNDDRECWPSVRHLMHKVRLSEAQARRVLKSLERQGLIEIELKQGRGTKGRESNRYHLCALSPIADDTSTTSARDTTTGIADDTLNHHYEPSIETSVEPTPTPSPSKGDGKANYTRADALINAWAEAQGYEGAAIGATFTSATNRKKAMEMLKWPQPPTPEEVRQTVILKRQTGKDYAFAFLASDIPVLRAKNRLTLSTPAAKPLDLSEWTADAWKGYSE